MSGEDSTGIGLLAKFIAFLLFIVVMVGAINMFKDSNSSFISNQDTLYCKYSDLSVSKFSTYMAEFIEEKEPLSDAIAFYSQSSSCFDIDVIEMNGYVKHDYFCDGPDAKKIKKNDLVDSETINKIESYCKRTRHLAGKT